MIRLAKLLINSHKKYSCYKKYSLRQSIALDGAQNSPFTFTNYPPNKIESCDAAKATARTKFISRSKL